MSDYYKEILNTTPDGEVLQLQELTISMSDKEASAIFNIVNSYDNLICFKMRSPAIHGLIHDEQYIVISDIHLKSHQVVFVHKVKDDWYFVEDGRGKSSDRYHYYKCDQWDGLIKCLEDIL